MSATEKQPLEILPEGKEFNEKVIIVGAGYAGISAARELLKYTDEENVIVLEAQSRVGGRVRSKKWEHPLYPGKGFHIELGAQWIGPGQDEINEWVDIVRKGIEEDEGIKKDEKFQLAKTYKEGAACFWFNGECGPEVGSKVIDEIVSWTASKIDSQDSKTTVAELLADSIGLNKLLRALKLILGSTTEATIRRGIEISFAMKPGKISGLAGLSDVKSAGRLSKITDVEGGAQESFLPAGFQNLLERIAAPFMNRIRFDEPVISIDQSGPENVIVTTTKQQHTAKRVIVAIPPILLASRASGPKIEPVVKFIPELSQERRDLISKLTLGNPIKCAAIFSRPFWRDRKFSGQTLTDGFPFAASYDCSPYEEGGPGVLTIFIKELEKGEFMLLDEESRRKKILLEIERYFGPISAEFLGLIVHGWDENSEPWAAGGYSCSYPPGVLRKYKNLLQTSWGRIHWASTETADKWRGFMEGAILSGRRAAHEVMDSF